MHRRKPIVALACCAWLAAGRPAPAQPGVPGPPGPHILLPDDLGPRPSVLGVVID